MNIQEAKTEIARTLRAYAKRNPDGSFRIPPEKQRPLLLIGPPGIGKTAIMRQIAEEQGCGLVAYSMTHHTRQSAIGLPVISQKEYGGRTYAVTEYTMSEIVASIYDYMAETGHTSGILFLDEVNCVSETLTPVMLQLLQNKTFGNVPLPEGWVIVAAGNPPEYNKSVRPLDMVTLDRVKHMEVGADLAVWMEYARAHGVHPAVRSYLTVYPDHFYNITDTDGGQLFVTARGWEDLSMMLYSYEEDGVTVTPAWFLQYLQHDEIARSFGLYYDLFRHFTEEAGAAAAANGGPGGPDRTQDGVGSLARLLLASPEKLSRRTSTECLAIAAMLYHPIETAAADTAEMQARLKRRKELAAMLPDSTKAGDARADEETRAFFEQKRRSAAIKTEHDVMKLPESVREEAALARLEDDLAAWRKLPEAERGDPAAYESALIENEERQLAERSAAVSADFGDAYRVLEHCPEGRSALLYFTNDLAHSEEISAVLERYPQESYERYAKEIG